MQMRPFGNLGQVSALTLGGGGIGNVWGAVDRAERIATVRAAVDAGITHIDVAPTYGPGEAELVVGEALGGDVPDDVLITTKVHPSGTEPAVVEREIEDSLRASMERLRVDHIDLLVLHAQLQPDEGPHAPRLISVTPFRELVRPVFERLRQQGRIRGWGLTAGHPGPVFDVLADDVRPDGIQSVANALDMSGNMWLFGDAVDPDTAGVRAAAVEAGVPVIGIRAVAAGSLTDELDRDEPDDPTARDFEAAAGFRRLAAERGESAAFLAHRYALSMPGLATVVLGVKNRVELEECLAAEAAAPLAEDELRELAAP
jgi:aryl-alcohol dehydrogenase-like predicted oxidoreductase